MKRLNQIPVDRIEKKLYILCEEDSTQTGEISRGQLLEGSIVLFDGFGQICRFKPDEEKVWLDGDRLLVRMEPIGDITILDVNLFS